MRARTLVEGVDLELEPVVAELGEQVPLEQARRLVGEPAAAKARVDREPLEPRDPAPLVRDVEAEHPGRLSVQLDHEAPEALRLGERALDLLDHLLAGRGRVRAEELPHVVVREQLEQEICVSRLRAPQLERHAARLVQPSRSRARRRRG